MNFRFFHCLCRILHFFMRTFDEILSGFRDKFQNRVTCVAFSIKSAKTNQKIAEHSEICENYSLLLVSLLFIVIHLCPYLWRGGPWSPGRRASSRAARRAPQRPPSTRARRNRSPASPAGARTCGPMFFLTPS